MPTKCFITVLLVVIQTGQVRAHVGDFIFPVYELPTYDLPDLHDRTLADWEDVLPDASLDSGWFFEGVGDPPTPDDLVFRVFLAWHHASQRIFVAFERMDDVLIAEYPAPADKMWFMVDGDHSGGRFANFPEDSYTETQRELLFYAQAQDYAICVDPPADGPLLITSVRQHDMRFDPGPRIHTLYL